MAGKAAAARRAQDGRAWLAWHTAMIPLLKKRPRLRDLLQPRPKRKRTKKQTAAEQLAIARRWAAATGTTVEG